MAFSQATITDGPTISAIDAELRVSWTSSSAAGTWFQVYANRKLAWSGVKRSMSLPLPSDRAWIQVGTVADGEQNTDFSSSLPSLGLSGNRAQLNWYGGRYLAEDVESFKVYGESTPGGGINYSIALATIAAHPNGVYRDGFGVGRFGQGGFGRSEVKYQWTSTPKTTGTWNWAVKAVDSAGNESSALTFSTAISVHPRPPAANADGSRLTYTYNSGTRVATLAWNASPG